MKNLKWYRFLFILFLLMIPSVLASVYNQTDVDLDERLSSCFLDNTNDVEPIQYIEPHSSVKDSLICRDDYFEINQILNPLQIGFAGPMESAWPMTCNDQRNTGRSPFSTSHVTGLEKWRFHCGGSDSGPVIDKEGNIYFGDLREYVISATPDGVERWRYKMIGGWILDCSLALSEYNVVYAGSWNDKLYALNATTGQRLWAKDTGRTIESSPVIADDGTIYTANFDGEVWAVYPNGTTRWVYETHGSDIWGDMAIDDNGVIYVGAHSGYLYAIYPNGTLRWKFKTGGLIRGTPSVGDDGTIYVYSWDNYLYALYPENATVKWKTWFEYGEETNVAIAPDGTLYYGGNDLWAFYPNGTLRWIFDPGEHHQIDSSNIAISAEGTLYFGTQINEVDGGDILAVNPDGTLLWRKRIADEWVFSSPCIAEDGTVYICSVCDNGGYLHAFGPVSSNSPPGTPTISGKTQWRVDIGKEWKFQAFDPENNPIRFYIDWGDGAEGWTNERASGEINNFYHKYTEKGSYTIRAKAQDVLGLESDWATYAIRIPNNYAYHPGWQWLHSHFPLLARILNLII